MTMWSKIGGDQPGAVDSALVAFGCKFIPDFTFSCQEMQQPSRVLVQASKFGVDENFHPVEALDFVLKISGSPSFDPDTDSLGLRAVAQLYAFRRYTCIKNNWIYRQTMRIPEANTINFCLEDEGTGSVSEEVHCMKEELVEQVKNGSVIGKKNLKVSLDQHYLKVFQPIKALSCIKIMAAFPFADDIDIVDAVSTVSHVTAFRRYVSLEHDWIYRETMRLSGSTDEAEANIKSSFSEDGQTCSMAEEEDKLSDEDKENSEDVDCIEEEFVEQVKSDSVISEKNCKVALEQRDVKVFEPVKALTFIQKMAVSLLVDNIDIVDAISTVAQVYAFRRYVFLEHDWIYRETMRLSGSTDEANINCSFSEDEQTCPVVEEEEKFSDEDKENSIGSSVAGFARGIPDCIGAANGIKRKKPWDVHTCSTNTVERGADFLRGTSNYSCLSNNKRQKKPAKKKNKRQKTQEVKACHSINNKEGAVAVESVCRNVHVLRRSARESSKKQRRQVPKICSRVFDMEDVEPVCRDVAHLLKLNTDSNSDPKISKMQKKEDVSKKQKRKNVKNFCRIRDMEDAVASVGRAVEPPKLDAESENNEKQKKDVKASCSIGNIEDAVDSVSENVDCVAVLTDCTKVSENDDRQRTKNVDVCCDSNKADGRDIADLIREIPEHGKESHSNQRKKNEKMNLCSTNNGESQDNADLHRYAKSNNMRKTEDVMVSCNIGNVVGRDTDTLRDPRYYNHESDSNKRQKTSTCDSEFHFPGSDRTFHEGNSASAADDQYRFKTPSHDLNDQPNIKLCKEGGIDGKLSSPPGRMMPRENFAPLYEVRFGVSPRQHPVSLLSHDNMNLHSSSGGVIDISNKDRHKNSVTQNSSKGNGTHKTHGAVISRMFRQSKTLLYPPNMFYYCPLRKDSPTSGCNSEPKPSKTHAQSEHPSTLHMKFPKDCVPPSKEELVKQFRRFGPLDYLKTKVYFYTCSAQVVFLNHYDAKAACNYARRKTIFPGGAKTRYWLYDHEVSRRANSISASLPTSTGSAPPVLKSCLRVSSPLGKKSRKSGLHVTFQATS